MPIGNAISYKKPGTQVTIALKPVWIIDGLFRLTGFIHVNYLFQFGLLKDHAIIFVRNGELLRISDDYHYVITTCEMVTTGMNEIIGK